MLWFPKASGLGWAYGFRKLSITDSSIRSKKQAVGAVLDRLIETGGLPLEHREGVLAAILKREGLGSTGIGRGVAVPHAKYPGVTSAVGALAAFPRGVDFDSMDGEPVYTVCLLVSPADRPGQHLRMLEAIARQLRSAG